MNPLERTARASLRKAYRATTDDERAAGMEWYARANGVVTKLAERYDRNVDEVAAVLAILSPATSWSMNQRDAEAVLDWFHDDEHGYERPAPTVTTYGQNLTKAIRYLNGDHTALSGPKVTAFAANLRGDLDYVTLDRWAFRAAIGRETPGGIAGRAATENAYRKVAAEFGLAPAILQAIIWVRIRGSAD